MHYWSTFRTLEKALNSENMPIELRIAAVDGLSDLGGRFARIALTEVINRDSLPVDLRAAAIRALGRIATR